MHRHCKYSQALTMAPPLLAATDSTPSSAVHVDSLMLTPSTSTPSRQVATSYNTTTISLAFHFCSRNRWDLGAQSTFQATKIYSALGEKALELHAGGSSH